MSRAQFITLEGIEGAGKSTVAKYVVDYLAGQGLAARLTREPGGTPLAERVRRIVLERGTEQVSAVTETLLMFAARALHVDNVIGPALLAGQWVVCDRFTDATRAYQGSGRGVDPALIESLPRRCIRSWRPTARCCSICRSRRDSRARASAWVAPRTASRRRPRASSSGCVQAIWRSRGASPAVFT